MINKWKVAFKDNILLRFTDPVRFADTAYLTKKCSYTQHTTGRKLLFLLFKKAE